MSNTCPLNFVQVDSYASRISSLLVSTLVIIYLTTWNEYILYFLVLDFFVKLYVNKDYSFIAILSMYLRKSLKIQEKFTDGGAKRLAAIFGFIFVSGLAIMDFFSINELYIFIVAFMFLSCSLLDVFINYCLGCKIYYIIKKLYPTFMN